MTEAHKVVLHDNQTSIEKLLKDKFSNKKEGSIDSGLLAVDSRLLIDGERYDYYDDDEVIEEEEEEEIEEGESDEEEANLCLSVYYKWIYNILHQMERSRFLNDSNKIVPFSCWFEYYLNDLPRQTLKKFTSASTSLVKFLPPSILCAPEEDHIISPQPHFTIKSSPVYIVKTDIALYESSTFSCVKLKSDTEGSIDAILFGEESNRLSSTETCLPPLFHFLNVNSHNRCDDATGILSITKN